VSKGKFSSTFDVSKYASMQSTNCSAYNKSTRVTLIYKKQPTPL